MRDIQVSVDDSLMNDIARLFPGAEDAASSLAALALREWVGWLVGTSRPMTISEQSIERIVDIYGTILTDEVPDASALYNQFSIPLGQARYIVQAISYKQAGALYRRALKDIEQAVDDRMAEREKLSKSERDAQTDIKIRILESSEKTLKELVLRLCYGDGAVPAPKRASTLGRYVYYSLRVKDVPAIQKVIGEKLLNAKP
jgi:hypothetical protein